MKTIERKIKSSSGTYFNGQLTLDKPIKTKKPVSITIYFEEEEPKPSLNLEDFSFLKMQEMLQGCTSSFAEEVVNERRQAL